MRDDELIAAARALATAMEPFAGQVHFSPECHAEYVALGFDPSPGVAGATQLPDRSAYLTSRGSVMGQVEPNVVAAAFAVFSPAVVVPAVAAGWTRTDAATICAARRRGATAQLRRILGPSPDGIDVAVPIAERAIAPLRVHGRPLFAGNVSAPLPDDPLERLWRILDGVREYRGDSHIVTWASEGLDGCEIGMLSDLYWRTPLRGHTGGRGWTADEMDAALERLRSRGLLDGDELTDAGRSFREGIETRTDRHMAPAVEAIGDDLPALVAILTPWSDAIRAAGGYLSPATRFTWQRA